MLLALGLSGAASGSDSYQNDVEFDFLNIEDDTTQVEVSIKSIGYRWYFQEVDGMSDPFELQPFLQKSSWAEAAFVWFNNDATLETEGTGLHFGARVVLPETPVGIDVEYLTLDADMAGTGDQDFLNELDIGAVVWLNDDNRLAIEAGLAFGELSFLAPAADPDFTRIRIGARGVIPIQDMNLEVAAHFASTSPDAAGQEDLDGIEVETRFFFNQEVFVGLSFSTVDDDTTDTDNWQISGGYSSPKGLDVGLSIGEGDAPGRKVTMPMIGDDPTFGVNVGLRF
jgi:hypothetical protein